jgi:hypothetical protein
MKIFLLIVTGMVIYYTFLMMGRQMFLSIDSRRGPLQLEYSIRSLTEQE